MAELASRPSATEPPPRLLFVTGRLAEPALRQTLQELGRSGTLAPEVAVLPISVAALATTAWIGSHLSVPPDIDRIYIPGLCSGDLEPLARRLGKPVIRGPNDLRDLPEALGQASSARAGYGSYTIEIIAEINHAPQLTLEQIAREAQQLRQQGADVIDVGCDPGGPWSGVGDAVRTLVDLGLRVSIDSFDLREIEPAVRAGAELVLSVHGDNRAAARDWGVEVVAIPDEPRDVSSLNATVEFLEKHGVAYRIDPILEPIGFDFAASLGRYLETRRRYPGAAMMMGIGNLTELTDVDSAGVNVLLLGICEELGVHSVLTTQVINWCRSSVQELRLARQLVHHAVTRRLPPKRMEPNLVMLRDSRLHEYGEAGLETLAHGIKDPNFRIFAERGQLHVINNALHLQNEDPFTLFEQVRQAEKLSSAHAFYLGYEMAKAVTALTLGKNYVQDQALRWGFLSVPEKSRHTTITKKPEPDDAGAP
jgi:dihydropteroate synthase-like protein